MEKSLYKCPVCNEALSVQNSALICAQNHSFDISSDNYVNLLLAQSMSSKVPGDSKEMLISRRRFLDGGHYAPLLDSIRGIISTQLRDNNGIVLDIGCGEGYYCGNFNLPNPIFGFDISKHGVKIAAKKYKDCEFSVASSYAIPFVDDSVDFAMCVFSPYSLEEVERVLTPKGYFLLVEPGENHLKDFIMSITGTFNVHEGNSPKLQDSNLSLVNQKNISFEIKLTSSQAILDLLKIN